MPLTRGQVIGHDTKRLTFMFTMLNDGVVIACQISDAALDQLAGMKGTERFARQAQFLSLRGTVEGIASRLFEREPRVNGQVVRIFTKHVGTIAKNAELEKQIRFLTQKLDETRRAFGMSGIIDEQLLAINARKDALARGHAA